MPGAGGRHIDFGRPGYYDPQGVEFPEISPEQTREEALSCLEALKELVSEMPFVCDERHGEINRSVFLAMLLTAAARPDLPAAPRFVLDAPVAGSGKTFLVNTVATMMTGHPAVPISQGASEEECEKRLGAVLRNGDNVVSLDNVEFPIQGVLVCQAVSEPYLQLRVLGKSETIKVVNSALYCATGNNLLVIGDMSRRALRCKIDPQVERPELRSLTSPWPRLGPPNVYAALTILKAFAVAGSPRQTEPLGSFEAWSRLVRDCLIWLGEPDPVVVMEATRQDDPVAEAAASLLSAWYEKFSLTPRTLKEVIDVSELRGEPFEGAPGKLLNGKLRDALQAVCGDGRPDTERLGKWVRSNKDRIFDEHMILRSGSAQGIVRWSVRHLTDKPEDQVQEELSTASIFTLRR
jgi:putative DNA primase/helicase